MMDMSKLARFVLASVLALALFAAAAHAQHPDCDLAARRFDSPLSYGQFAGWNMPRYGWHAFDAATSVVFVEAIHRTTKASRRRAAWIVPAASIALHLIGHARGRFGWTIRDWVFDAGVRSLPLVLTSRDKPLSLTLYAAAYVGSSCFASP